MTIDPTLSDSEGSPQAAFLQEYQTRIQRELSRITDDAIDQWMKDSDQAFRNAVKQAIDEATQQVYSEIADALEGNSDNANMGDFSRRMEGILSNLVAAQVNNLLFPTRTSVTVNETERSRRATQDIRLSRSQQQAANMRNVMQGQRNL